MEPRLNQLRRFFVCRIDRRYVLSATHTKTAAIPRMHYHIKDSALEMSCWACNKPHGDAVAASSL